MKTQHRLTATAAIVGLFALCFAADALTPDAVLKDSAKYDGKEVTVRGMVTGFSQKTSKKGNAYFVFKLETKDKKHPLNVYGHGTLEPGLKDKQKVEVAGKFVKEKKVGTMTFTNEVDCSGVGKEAPHVKVLP